MAQELVWPLPPSVYSLRFRRCRCRAPASPQSLLWHPGSPGLRPANRGGSGLSQHLGKTPTPARTCHPSPSGRAHVSLASQLRGSPPCAALRLVSARDYPLFRRALLGCWPPRYGGGPHVGHRVPEGSDSPEGAPCDDLLGIV